MISEYPPFFPGRRDTFSRRNRLIAALSKAVVVIQGKRDSGSLITARWGLRLSKKVLAVLGDMVFENSLAGYEVLKEGGEVFTPHCLEELGIHLDLPVSSPQRLEGTQPSGKREEPRSLGPKELEIVEKIRQGAGDLDSLCEETGLSVSQLLAIVGMLEIKGIVRNIGGKWVCTD